MPGLTGTSAKRPAAKPLAPAIRLKDLLDQLDTEFEQLKRQERELDEQLLWVYFQSCVRPALHWVNGDPYTFEFPAAYQVERLAKLCGYLKSLQGAEAEKVLAAREVNLKGLLTAWPAYRDLAIPDHIPNGTSIAEQEVLPFSWEAIETLWDGENWTGEGEKARGLFLPQFGTKASADFHLAGLAVLFLNRQLRLPLSDLTPQGGN
ncbi:hypothetical protein [Deinococcus hopiensis]|uniref:Uncharacterized protein n=1 Tax=Deinococcus hopiensis KR-140 TaxID=695939 RepID=A0A1W1VJ21_9DEIO|nr:hypothetical protein [Deinococcus hopiensis]SMB93362.1 hypothetical protein SAMN00790413_01953 [Deinococcus hopiensis KR-140]